MKRTGEALRSASTALIPHVALVLIVNVVTTLALLPVIGVTAAVLNSAGQLAWTLPTLGVIVAVLPCPLVLPLQRLTNRLTRDRTLFLVEDARKALLRHGMLTLKIWLLSLAVAGVLVGNLVFYSTHLGTAGAVLRFVWMYALLAFLMLQIYIFPLIVEGRAHSIRQAYGDAMRLTFLFPGFTALIVVVWLALVAAFALSGTLAIIGLAVTSAVQQGAIAAVLEPLEGMGTVPETGG